MNDLLEVMSNYNRYCLNVDFFPFRLLVKKIMKKKIIKYYEPVNQRPKQAVFNNSTVNFILGLEMCLQQIGQN